MPPPVVDLIRKKRDGGVLSDEDIKEFISRVEQSEVEQCQLGAMLMAIYLKDMTLDETISLTRAMMQSGETLQWPSEWSTVTVDKHSTGGVGDKISLILTPALAACGLKVPMITGHGLGFSGGTLDKMESIPGFNSSCSIEQIKSCVQTAGCCIAGQTKDIVPADRILYACRGITATVASIPLICASILSKKAAESISSLVVDIKVGSAAFMKSVDEATELAENLVRISKYMGIKTVAVLTKMDWPIGQNIGNALEVAESIQGLHGKMDYDVKELVLTLGGHLLLMSGSAETLEEGKQLLWSKVKNGEALRHFRDLIVCQGVAESAADLLVASETDVWAVLPKTQFTTKIFHDNDNGYVHDVDALALAHVCLDLGTGRLNRDDNVNHSTGLQLKVVVGQRIARGQEWLIIHHDRIAIDATIVQKATTALTVRPDPLDASLLKRVIKVVS